MSQLSVNKSDVWEKKRGKYFGDFYNVAWVQFWDILFTVNSKFENSQNPADLFCVIVKAKRKIYINIHYHTCTETKSEL